VYKYFVNCLSESRILAENTEDTDCFICGGALSESGFSGLEDKQDNTCKNTKFHGDFTEIVKL